MRTAAFLPPASSRETFPVQPWASTLAPIQPRASAPAPVQPRSAQTPLTKPTRASVWARKEAAHEPLAPSPAPASGIRHVRVAAVCIQLRVRAALLKRAHGKMLCQAEQHSLSKAVCVGEKVNDTDKKKVNKPLGPTDSPKHRGASRLRSSDTSGVRCRSHSGARERLGPSEPPCPAGGGAGGSMQPTLLDGPNRGRPERPMVPSRAQSTEARSSMGTGRMAGTAFGCSASRGARALAQPGPGRSAASSKAHAEIPGAFFNGCFLSNPSTL